MFHNHDIPSIPYSGFIFLTHGQNNLKTFVHTWHKEDDAFLDWYALCCCLLLQGLAWKLISRLQNVRQGYANKPNKLCLVFLANKLKSHKFRVRQEGQSVWRWSTRCALCVCVCWGWVERRHVSPVGGGAACMRVNIRPTGVVLRNIYLYW